MFAEGNEMKAILLAIISLVVWMGQAASFSWEYVYVIPGEIGGTSVKAYTISGSIHAGSLWWSVASTEGPFLGYKDEDGFYLKQCDHQSTASPAENNLWVLAVYGEVLSYDTIENAHKIPLCDWYDGTTTGGTLIETPEDFYLGFMVNGYDDWSDMTWFGWLHVSVDDELSMSLLDAGIGLNGEAVRIGIGAIPEPSCVLLLLLGLGVLGLCRKRMGA